MQELSYADLFGLILAVMLVWISVSILISIIKMNKTYVLEASRFIFPASCKPDDCKDVAGFIGFMTPRFVIFCILCLLFAVFLLLLELTTVFDWVPNWFNNGSALFLFLPVFIWYVIFINKAAKKFW